MTKQKKPTPEDIWWSQFPEHFRPRPTNPTNPNAPKQLHAMAKAHSMAKARNHRQTRKWQEYLDAKKGGAA